MIVKNAVICLYLRPVAGHTQCCRRAVTMLFRRVLTGQLKRPKSSLVSANNSVLHFDEIPSPKSFPIIGTTLSLLARGSMSKLHDYVDKRHKKLGPIYKESIGPVSCVFVSDPEEIRVVFEQEGRYPMHLLPEAWVMYNQLYGCPRGLFFMNGPNWWHHRRIVNKILLKGDFKWMEDACECVSDKLVRHLHNSDDDNYFDNLEGTLYKWSVDVIASVLLGAETYLQHYEDIEPKIVNLAEIIHSVFQTTAKLSLIPVSFASKYKIPRWRRFVESVDNALASADSLVVQLIQVSGPESNGLLPKLLQEEIEIQDVKRIIVDLILAAGDTTAVAMEWILYLIGKNKKVQEKLRSQSQPDYVNYVIRESLRLYPVAPFLTRILPEDSIVAGYGVPKDTLMILSIYTSSRDERYFKNPTSFIPERWDRSNSNYSSDMQKASLPFAMGLRACVGKKLAQNQLQKAILNIVNHFQIEVCNKRDVDIKMKMVTHPSEPLQLRFRKL
jgi:ecdysteroid 2-hydroxylase